MSWRTEVIADRSGEWKGNGPCFATRPEAHAYVIGLMLRWTAVRDTREIEVDEPVTHRWDPAVGVVEVEELPLVDEFIGQLIVEFEIETDKIIGRFLDEPPEDPPGAA